MSPGRGGGDGLPPPCPSGPVSQLTRRVPLGRGWQSSGGLHPRRESRPPLLRATGAGNSEGLVAAKTTRVGEDKQRTNAVSALLCAAVIRLEYCCTASNCLPVSK